ncbi:hypothetical protein SAMN05421740_101181 [Parapedobacter koreensis]|uniref:Uncharacterized protein n=1 Tax=Parapedobacter koreensis TaxID=332977 RepID=A0A1H7F289_9SPHI|nr:hypothetical protein SAMN05421740_101181 [Parapedobacter koreensis]
MKYIYYSLFILLLYSCQEKPTNTITEEFEKRGVEIPEEVEICIIMPSVGCGAYILPYSISKMEILKTFNIKALTHLKPLQNLST